MLKQLRKMAIGLALAIIVLSPLGTVINPLPAQAGDGPLTPEIYKNRGDDNIKCDAASSDAVYCSVATGTWGVSNDHGTQMFFFSPQDSTGDYDVWVGADNNNRYSKASCDGDCNADPTAFFICKRTDGYSVSSSKDAISSCFVASSKSATIGQGASVGIFNTNKLADNANPPDTCSVKMFGGGSASHPTSCKWGGNGHVQTVSSEFRSGYDIWKGKEDATHACESAVGMLSFILCPIMGMANNAIMALIGTSNMPAGTAYNSTFPSEGGKPSEPQGILISMLQIRPLLEKDGAYGAESTAITNENCQPGDSGYACGIRTVWANLKNITLGIFVVIFLVIIFANTASIGIDNYTIKKMLPRLIASAILIQFSLLIVSLAVDVFNIIGGTIPQLILGLAASRTGNFCGLPNNQSTAGAIGPSMGMTFSVFLTSPVGQIVGSVGAIILLILIIMVAIAAITAFFALIARRLIIFGLVIIAPLAFAAYILPGTEKYFKLWRDNLLKSLAMYPIATGLLAGSLLFSSLIIGTNACSPSNGLKIDVLVAMLTPMMAMLMLPKTFKWGGNLTSAIAGGIMGAGMAKSKAFGRAAKNTGKNTVKRGYNAGKNAGQDKLAQTSFGKNNPFGRMLAGGGIGGLFGTAGGRQKVIDRANSAQSQADKAAGGLVRQMEENNRLLNDPHANLTNAQRKRLQDNNRAINNQLFGAGASPAMRAAGIKAIANDHNMLRQAHAAMGQANFERAMVASGMAETAVATLQGHAMSFADGSTERAAIQSMFTGANVSPEVRAAGIKAMTATKDGNGLIRAHMAAIDGVVSRGGSVEQAHRVWQDSVSRSGVSGADMAEAISRSTAGIVSPADPSKPASIIPGDAHYSEEKARAYSVLTGVHASPSIRASALGKFAETGNQEGIEAVRQGIIASHTVGGVYNEAAAKAEWDSAVTENYSKFDNAGGHLRQFTNQARADELGKLDNPAFAKLSGREQKVLTSPGMMETLPSRILTDATPQNRHEISGDARTNAAQWAHGGADMVDADGQPVITAARRAKELRDAGNEAGAQAVEQKAADFRTVLDASGNWIDSTPPGGGTPTPGPTPGAPPSPTTSGGSEAGWGAGAAFALLGHTTPEVDDGSPPEVGTPYVNPVNPPTTPATPPDDDGSGGVPFNPMSFDPLGSDLDPTYSANKAAQTRILQDMASGATAQEAADTNLVNEVVSPAPTENTTVAPSAVNNATTGTTAGVVAGTVVGKSEAGWGAGADLARYETERRAKDAARKAREASEAQGARITELKKSQDRQARGKTHKDARGNEVSGPAPNHEAPNE